MAPRGQLQGPSSRILDRRDSKRKRRLHQQRPLKGGYKQEVARLLAQEVTKQSPLELPVTTEEAA